MLLFLLNYTHPYSLLFLVLKCLIKETLNTMKTKGFFLVLLDISLEQCSSKVYTSLLFRLFTPESF